MEHLQKVLVLSATAMEVAPFASYLSGHAESLLADRGLEFRLCVGGVGLMHTAYSLLKAIRDYRPDFCLQAGIAGAFDPERPLGGLVSVRSECLGDWGADDNGRFLDMFDLGLARPFDSPFQDRRLANPYDWGQWTGEMEALDSVTVQKATGSQETARLLSEKFGADIENMEGAAFHFVCLEEQIPFLQVRALSNYVGPRDRSLWEIDKALKSLNDWLVGFAEERSKR